MHNARSSRPHDSLTDKREASCVVNHMAKSLCMDGYIQYTHTVARQLLYSNPTRFSAAESTSTTHPAP